MKSWYVHDRCIVWWRFHCTGKVPRFKSTTVVSHSCAVYKALTTDLGMGRVSQKCYFVPYYLQTIYRVAFLEGIAMVERP